MISKYQKVAVIGAGTMGNGIAHLFAMNGYEVTLIDVRPEALEKALATIGKKTAGRIGKLAHIDLVGTIANILPQLFCKGTMNLWRAAMFDRVAKDGVFIRCIHNA